MKSEAYNKLIKLLEEAVKIIKKDNEPGDITIEVGHVIDNLIDKLIRILIRPKKGDFAHTARNDIG